jgi:hypothetical protein
MAGRTAAERDEGAENMAGARLPGGSVGRSVGRSVRVAVVFVDGPVLRGGNGAGLAATNAEFVEGERCGRRGQHQMWRGEAMVFKLV